MFHQEMGDQDPGEMEPMKPRREVEWYTAVVTRWIADEDMEEILTSHIPGEAESRRTFELGLKSERLEGDELDELARIAFSAAMELIGWLEKKHDEGMSAFPDPESSQKELEEGRGNALGYAGHIVSRRAARGHWHTREWENEQDAEEWSHAAILRKQEAARTGDHHNFLRILDELHQECRDPGTPQLYAQEREARWKAMDELSAEWLEQDRKAWEQLNSEMRQDDQVLR